MSTELIDLFSKLTINDIRQNKSDDDINILSKMMSNLKITEPDDLTDLIDQMEQLTITEDEVIIEFKDHQIFKFRYTYFNCGDKIINTSNWGEAY